MTKTPDHESAPESHKAKMAPRAEAAPGLEQDGKGNVIPLPQRTQDDQEKARTGRKD
jgi:hypothetical protein